VILPLYPDLHVENDEEILHPEGHLSLVHSPTIEVFLPPAETRSPTSVLICPGGGYHVIAIEHEGRAVARWFNSIGISAFILKYRLPPNYRHPVPLSDAQRAMQLIRSKADEWKIDPEAVGVMGFSAGGHLASSLATAADMAIESARDSIARSSSHPDFAILIYPVITMHAPTTHVGSRDHLLGSDSTDSQRMEVSTELSVTNRTPPTFLLTATDDLGVSPQNSIAFHAALQRCGVPAELHLLPEGGHGFGMNHPHLNEQWLPRLVWWLEKRGLK